MPQGNLVAQGAEMLAKKLAKARKKRDEAVNNKRTRDEDIVTHKPTITRTRKKILDELT